MNKNASVSDTSMLEEVVTGLSQPQKRLPSKLFYDERGSELFEQITQLDEYYLTRAEKQILASNIKEISDYIGPKAVLVELGSGSSKKTRLLLDKLNALAAYVPVDISKEFLLKVAHNLRNDYPEVSIIPVFADYTSPFDLPEFNKDYNKQVIFFPGSTIGNFHPERAQSFLATIASLTDKNTDMLVGVDLKKDSPILKAAYNDKQGITARFNKNILVRLNRELGANFDINCFAHHTLYNEKEGCIEMHLVSQANQKVTINGSVFCFDEGESIHTENSYKYSLNEFEELASRWFTVEQVWTDEQDYFSLQFLSRR